MDEVDDRRGVSYFRALIARSVAMKVVLTYSREEMSTRYNHVASAYVHCTALVRFDSVSGSNLRTAQLLYNRWFLVST